MAPVLEKFNARVFSECLHTPFLIQIAGHQPLTVELVEVTESGPSPQMEQFALYFRGPLSPYVPQATHHLTHDRLGSFDLFLVPVGPDGTGMRYESIFNRFRKSGEGA